MENIAENLKKTITRIDSAVRKYRRPAGSVCLLAVSKSQQLDSIVKAAQAGQIQFGENYAQEAVAKIDASKRYNLVWHFIGPVQSNKTSLLAESFDWVHSIDRIKVARRLCESRPDHLSPLNVCIQLNISGEPSKSGVVPSQLMELVTQVQDLPRLRLRGLMVIPAEQKEFEDQRLAFRKTRLLLEQINQSGLQLDTLSMGMSGDFEAAIAEGSTMVRIGTAIFGPRQT